MSKDKKVLLLQVFLIFSLLFCPYINLSLNILPNTDISPSLPSPKLLDSTTLNVSQHATVKIEKWMNSSDNIYINSSSLWKANWTARITNIYNQTVHCGDAEVENDYYWKNYERDQPDDLGFSRYLNNSEGLISYSGNYSWTDNISNWASSLHQVDYSGGGLLHGNSVIVSFAYNLFSENNLSSSYSYVKVVYNFTSFILQVYLWSYPHPLYPPKNDSKTVSLIINDSWHNSWRLVSFNASKLGLEICDKLPLNLWEIDIEVGVQNPPYSAIILFDEISCIDLVFPSEVDLKINNQKVIDFSLGQGFLSWKSYLENNLHVSVNETNISGFKTEKTWHFFLEINISRVIVREIDYERHNSTTIKWNVTFQVAQKFAENMTSFILITIPFDWNFLSMLNPKGVQMKDFCIELNDSIHQIIIPDNILIKGEWQIFTYSPNYLELISPTSSISVTHEENINISAKLRYSVGTVNLSIVDTTYGNVLQTTVKESDIYGIVTFEVCFPPQTSRSNISAILRWFYNWEAGEEHINITLTTKPTKIAINSSEFKVFYPRKLSINLSYIDLENNLSILGAHVTYQWEYDQGKFIEDPINQIYILELPTYQLSLNNSYQIFIKAAKEGYATVIKVITIFIENPGFKIDLSLPKTAYSGETITVSAKVFDSYNVPLNNITVLFFLNSSSIGAGFTNESGYASIQYYISSSETNRFLEFHCEIVIHNKVVASSSNSIEIISPLKNEKNFWLITLTFGVITGFLSYLSKLYLQRKKKLSLFIKL